LTNGTTAAINSIAVTFSSTTQFSGTTGGTCGTTLGAGASCTIGVVFHPTTSGGQSAELTITSSATVVGSPVALEGTGFIPTASVTPTSLAFGNWATGLTSPGQAVTITNTGTSTLTGGTFTTAAPFHVIGTGTTCGGTLAVGASCTVAVDFAPTAAVASNGTLAVAYTGATVTPPTVALTGTGVAARATVSISPNPLTITLPSGSATGQGTVTLTNTAPAAGSQLTVTTVAVSGGSLLTYVFNAVAGQDHCTGVTLAPGATCTVGVRFTNVLSPRGANRAGTITFTDNATGSPQTGNLVGHAN